MAWTLRLRIPPGARPRSGFSVVVADGIALVASEDGNLHAIDVGTGGEKWKAPFAEPLYPGMDVPVKYATSTPAVGGRAVFIGHQSWGWKVHFVRRPASPSGLGAGPPAAIDGYTAANVDLIYRVCDAKRQGSKGYT